jgi:cell division protein FtsB
VLAAILTALLLAAIYPLRAYFEQRSRIAELERRTAAIAEQNSELQARIEQLHDPAFLERIARECLGMVKLGETPFVVIPAEDDPEPLPC